MDPFSCPAQAALQALASQSSLAETGPHRSGSPPAQPANRSDALTPRVQRPACTAQPYGPVRPPEPSSTAQLQATLTDKCTAEWF